MVSKILSISGILFNLIGFILIMPCIKANIRDRKFLTMEFAVCVSVVSIGVIFTAYNIWRNFS